MKNTIEIYSRCADKLIFKVEFSEKWREFLLDFHARAFS